MNIWDIVIIAAVVLAAAAAVYSIIKNRKSCSCGCDCGCCDKRCGEKKKKE